MTVHHPIDVGRDRRQVLDGKFSDGSELPLGGEMEDGFPGEDSLDVGRGEGAVDGSRTFIIYIVRQ